MSSLISCLKNSNTISASKLIINFELSHYKNLLLEQSWLKEDKSTKGNYILIYIKGKIQVCIKKISHLLNRPENLDLKGQKFHCHTKSDNGNSWKALFGCHNDWGYFWHFIE